MLEKEKETLFWKQTLSMKTSATVAQSGEYANY